ncbi:MAG: MoaD/ThiS family protein [Nocardioidaceae bacterium]
MSADEPDLAPVTVRYWASVRAAAGRAQDTVPAGTLSQVIASVRKVHEADQRFASVVSICAVLVGSEPVGTRDPDQVVVAPGDTVELLPPFAGG